MTAPVKLAILHIELCNTGCMQETQFQFLGLMTQGILSHPLWVVIMAGRCSAASHRASQALSAL